MRDHGRDLKFVFFGFLGLTHPAKPDFAFPMIRENGNIVYPLETVADACRQGEVTQKEVADRAGIPTATVSDLLTGRTGKVYEKAKKLFEALEAIRAERSAAVAKEESPMRTPWARRKENERGIENMDATIALALARAEGLTTGSIAAESGVPEAKVRAWRFRGARLSARNSRKIAAAVEGMYERAKARQMNDYARAAKAARQAMKQKDQK